MTHYTMTGYYAGQTLCGKEIKDGDKGVHPKVNFTEEFFKTHNVCLECRAIWEDEAD